MASMNQTVKKNIKIDCNTASRPVSRSSKTFETPILRSNGEILGSNRAQGRSDDDSKKFLREFLEVSQFFDTMTNSKIIRSVEEAEAKEYLNRIIVLTQDWKSLPEEVQNQVKREELASRLVPMLQHESPNVKFRVIRAGLFTMKHIGFADYITNSAGSQNTLDAEASFANNTERDESDSVGELYTILKSLARLSKEVTYDSYFLQEGLYLFILEILAVIPTLKMDPQVNLLSLLLNTLKNISGNDEIRKKSLDPKNCVTLANLLNYLNDWTRVNKKKAKQLYKILYSLTALLRNLAADPTCIISYYETGIIPGLCDVIQQDVQEADLILNCLRILSKLSLNRDCCFKIGENENNILNFIQILKIHRNGLYIVIRAAFILANITTYLEKTREYLYFERKIFPQLLDCFYFYIKKVHEKVPQDMDKIMRTSFAKFDKASANEKDQDALTKLVRLMANLFTLDKIGYDFVTKEVAQYKLLLRHVCAIIKDKEVTPNIELLIAGLSFIANAMFFEKQILVQDDFELRTLRTEILFTLSRFVIQTDSEEVCLEALRVLSNLSRDKALAKQITKIKLVEAVVALLKHNNKDVVYYSLGIVMNLMLTEEMKKPDIQQNILNNVVNILFESTIEEFDIVSCCLKCATNILDTLQKPSIDGNTMKTLEELIVNYGEQCDVIMTKDQKDENGDIQDLRGIINHLLNIMPEEGFTCSQPNCGRKFKSEKELKNHVTRRHGV